MTVTAVETAREAVAEIDDFERQIRSLITRDNAPTEMQSLSERAEATRDELLELSGAGIELELSDELRRVLSYRHPPSDLVHRVRYRETFDVAA